jgi:hypothetical protein
MDVFYPFHPFDNILKDGILTYFIGESVPCQITCFNCIVNFS